MSTKAIREALEWMRSDGYTVNDALAEVEAIERAAKTLHVDGPGRVGDNPQFLAWADAMSLMDRIAEQD